jgi:hypothetical protein
MRFPVTISLLAALFLSVPAFAQSIARAPSTSGSIVLPGNVPPEIAAQQGRPPGAPVPGQPASGGQRTPEQERAMMLQQIVIDRSTSGILQARLQDSRPPEEAKAPPPPQDPDKLRPPEAFDPPTPAQQKQLKAAGKRKQYKMDVENFRLNVVMGEWAEVRSFLDSLPENDAQKAYKRVLSQLGSPVKVNPRPELALLGAKTHSQDQYLRPEEILALSDISRKEPDREALKQLAKLISKTAPPPESFFAILRNGTRYFGTTDLETRRRTAEFLLNGGLLDQSAEYLPDIEAARESKEIPALNLIARFHTESFKADKGKNHLPIAWSLCLEILGNKEAPLNERGEALYRALALIPELEDESGKAWLQKTFTNPKGEGFEILAAVGTLSSQSRQMTGSAFRHEQLKLQAAAARALLGTEGADLAAWTETLTVYALNWIHEAKYSYQRDQNTSMRPQMQLDPFGNPFYVRRQVSYDGRGLAPIPVGDLLECNPGGKWLANLDETVRLDCMALMARLYLKMKEEGEAFPILQSLAKIRPKQVEDLVREMISVWATNHNPNQSSRYRSSYYYYYGANRRAETIPLTRSKQERNLRELAKLVAQVGTLKLEASFEEEFSDAFIQAHSQAEVWRVEALVAVFGELGALDTKTIAALLRRMRTNLATLWPNPKLQENYKTKRRDKELALHVLKGYRAAKGVASAALAREPENWPLQVQLASLHYEQSNYESSFTPQSDHSTTKRASLDRLAAASQAYAATLPLEDEKEESTEVFETWLFAALGSPDLGALKAHHQPVPSEFARIKAALAALPEDTVERHLDKFATTINNRLANVSPDLKYRYLGAALQIIGEHERIKSATDVYQYYQDLITEIKLDASIDGPDTVGSTAPFGLYVNLRHTKEIERESGGFQRYLQNQNNTSFSYNYGRPTEDYRDKFEKAARGVLEEHFEVLSLTFHESKIVSRSDPVLGWRVTPYAYFLLKCRGPEVDSIPPLSIDLDFLDTSGYVVLPISTSALPIDASKPSQARPVRDLKVTLTLDERTAEEEDSLHLDVKASGHGLIPPLEVLLDLPPAGFTIADTEDRELLIEELDAETDDGAPLSTHEWRIKLVPEGDRSPKEFTFPSVQVETAEEEGLTLQRYEDVDLVSVPATVTLGARVGRGFNPWLLLLLIPALALLSFVLWLVLRRSGPPPIPYTGPVVPSTLTPVTLLAFLERLRAYEGLSKDRRPALESEITLLQDRFFGPEQESDATTDLHEIALKWKPAA